MSQGPTTIPKNNMIGWLTETARAKLSAMIEELEDYMQDMNTSDLVFIEAVGQRLLDEDVVAQTERAKVMRIHKRYTTNEESESE